LLSGSDVFAEAKKIILDDNAAILSKLQEGQAKVAADIQTVQGGALLSPAAFLKARYPTRRNGSVIFWLLPDPSCRHNRACERCRSRPDCLPNEEETRLCAPQALAVFCGSRRLSSSACAPRRRPK
jgi:hypothetical protein